MKAIMLKLLPCLEVLSCVQCCVSKTADTDTSTTKIGKNNQKKKKMSTDFVKGVISKVYDGDTVTFVPDDKNEDEWKIRLAEIDAPESDQPGGKESTQFLRDMALLKDAKIKVIETDKYGRKVGKVYVGRKCMNKAMLQEGLAWHYKDYSKNTEYRQLMESAQSQKKGIFRQKNPIPPWEWRKQKKAAKTKDL